MNDYKVLTFLHHINEVKIYHYIEFDKDIILQC